MFKRPICAIVCILVLGSASINTADVIDESLVGWWKFDEGSGTIAADSSGNGNDGVLMGDPEWATGWLGRGLLLDGDGDYVDCGNAAIFDITEQITLTTWLKTNDAMTGAHHHWLGKGDHTYAIKYYEGDVVQFFVYDGSWLTANFPVPSSFNGGWHHIVGMYDGSMLYLYIDGEEVDTTEHEGSIETRTHNLTIGENSEETGRYSNSIIDDARIYNRALSLEELADVMVGSAFDLAGRPNPDDGELEAPRDAMLTWEPGSWAATHNVYFSTSPNDVIDSSEAALVAEGLADAAYAPADLLDYNGTYYWRVDEVNDAHPSSPGIGDFWTFTVVNFLVADDFESYNDDDNPIYDTWFDGWVNGTTSTIGNLSPPYTEQTVVHGGAQSMPFEYDNFSSPNYAEASREWAEAQDWTTDDTVSLSLWLIGDGDNAAEPLYMGVEDSAGNLLIVTHDDPEILLVEEWQEWSVDLNAFADAGVDVTAIQVMYLGVGDRDNPVPGLPGKFYVDDIRLYRAQ